MRKLTFYPLQSFLLTLLCTCIIVNTIQAQNTHPVILGDTSQYAALRVKATQYPWSEMVNTAIYAATNDTYESLSYYPYDYTDYKSYCYRLRSLLSSCAIAYIVDAPNQSFYADRAAQQMQDGLTYIIDNRANTNDWTYNVVFGMALFEAIIALDVLYHDMSPTDRTTIENMLDNVVYTLRENAWELSERSIVGTWELYKSNQSAFDIKRQEYNEKLMDYSFSTDGVFYPGTGYSLARMTNHDRNQKHFFMDILEIQGYNDYYTNPVLINGHEWIAGYTGTPFGKTFPFGDTSPSSSVLKWTSISAAYRFSRFSQAAMEYANWNLDSAVPRPSLIMFMVMDNDYDFNQQSIAPGKIFEDGGAWFRENRTDENILSAALWNCKQEEGHSHFETNAICLAGYGELLMGNSGYNGWGSGSEDWTWTDIQNRAVTGNTVLIDYPLSNSITGSYPSTNNHQYKSGAGIAEGLTTGVLDYACGDSGDALPNGSHERNFMFIHPDTNVPGYWILMDKISGNANSTGHIALHPYSDNVTTVSSNKEYRWAVQLFGSTSTYLSVHLANQPDQLQLLSGISADFDGDIPQTFMYNSYNLGADGEKEVITLLFPHQNSGDSPNTSNLNTANYTGSVVDLGNNIEDHIIESANPSQSVYYNSLTGNMSVVRTENGLADWYFVKSGTEFSWQSVGFTSSQPISIFMNGDTGQAIAENSTTVGLDLEQPVESAGVQLNGQTISSTVNNGYLNFTLPAGTHDIVIIESAGQDTDGDGVLDADDACPGFDDNMDVDGDNIPDFCDCHPVIATADDGNIPANTLDGDLSTRWSALGLGQAIQYCLDLPVDLDCIDIAFYLGDMRTTTFDVEVLTDNDIWVKVLENAVSNGTTLQLESFTFDLITAYKIRITGYGNSLSEWNSYTEVSWGTCCANPIGTTCDDGDPNTINDVWDENCNCIGVASGEVDLDICLWLEGVYTSNSMSNTLENLSLLSAQQPYNTAPWNYNGAETLSGTGVVDWVLVSLRTGLNKEDEIGQVAGLLQQNGCVVFPEGTGLSFDQNIPVYIVVEHRNHLPAMTPQPVNVINNTLTFDFRSTNSYNNFGLDGQKQLPDGNWCLYTGDIQQLENGYDINGADKGIWAQNNGLFNGYFSPDLNMDGDVNGGDKSLWNNNNGIYSAVLK